jgi:hypothetical protein
MNKHRGMENAYLVDRLFKGVWDDAIEKWMKIPDAGVLQCVEGKVCNGNLSWH